ncbi:MAG: TetR family transcriptional regulator, partial [Phycisphaerae bacterium]|nr:TetR family transcriptional regulator [Phycisphaerae bacterium]
MGKRKDGLDRKAQLLEAATKVFARKGYDKTTVADICQTAKSNTASVNYYFGSKEELYAEVWTAA